MASENPATIRPRVLLLEDERALSEEISTALCDEGFDVNIEENGEDGLAAARRGDASVLVVDRMLRGSDGLALVETIRSEGDATPVLFISALSAVDDRIRGLKAGGDDYLVKPFALGELVARVEALLRRGERAQSTRLRAGALEIDLVERRVWRDGGPIELLPREFKLLAYFMRRSGQIVT